MEKTVINSIDDVRSIEDFISFKYQSMSYAEWLANGTSRKFPKLKIAFRNQIIDCTILDAISYETDLHSNVKLELKVIVQLPNVIEIKGEFTNVLHLKNTCVSQEGCLDIDWASVTCLWTF